MSEPPYGQPDPNQQPPEQPREQPPEQQSNPYGQQPYGQQPYQQPYGQPGYSGHPGPYGATAPVKSNTTRNVLLIVGAVVLLFCGGIVALVLWAFNEAGDAIADGIDGEDAVTVEEGAAFTFDGIEFDEGWKLESEGSMGSDISGLRATNPPGRAGSDYVSIDVRMLDGDDILAEISCSSTGSIGEGQSKVLTCLSADALPATWDSISIDDY